MSIKAGDKAPDFTLVTKTPDGPQIVKLSEQIGNSNIVLFFVPMAFTGVCTTELCDVSSGISEYESLDAKVFAISGDNPFAQEAWATKEGITVTLLSDYEHKAAADYGIAYDQFLPDANLIMGGVAKRSAFLIDKTGTVRFADVKDHPKDLPDFKALTEILKTL